MPIVRLPRMSKKEIGELIREQFLCRMAFMGEKYPHIVPLQYVLLNDSLYFHFSEYGIKIKMLKNKRPVCVEIEKYKPDLSEFQFVILEGSLEVVTDPREREEAIGKIAEQGRQLLSTNFLIAHGFKEEDDWSSFTPARPLTIVRLTPATRSGLKSR